MSGAYTLNIPQFRIDYPEFSDPAKFSDNKIQTAWNTGTCIVANSNYGALSGDCRYNALTLITAHILAIGVMIADGQTPAQVNSATIDKITVSLTTAPNKTQFQWWLNLTGYGQTLLTILQVALAGGLYIGGGPERAAFVTPGNNCLW